MDAMGHDILSENFDNFPVDVSIRTNQDFDGNFSTFTSLFNNSLTDKYSEIEDIYGAIKFQSESAVFDYGQPINWSFYEQKQFRWDWFNHSVFYGINPEILNQNQMQDLMYFESATGDFDPSDNEVYIDKNFATQRNISMGDNLSIGNYFRTWYPVEANFTELDMRILAED